MSKKSRRRNRRLLKAAALIGGLAMLGRGRGTGVSGSDKAKFTSDAAYSIPGGDESSFKVQDVKVNVPSPAKTNVVTTGNVLGRMRGHGDQGGVTGQNKRAAYAQKMRNAVTGVDGPPSVLNPYKIPRVHRGRGNFMAKGGRVKGGGKAKRGLGKAFKGGK